MAAVDRTPRGPAARPAIRRAEHRPHQPGHDARRSSVGLRLRAPHDTAARGLCRARHALSTGVRERRHDALVARLPLHGSVPDPARRVYRRRAALGHCPDGAHPRRTAPESRLPELRGGGESRFFGSGLRIRARLRRVVDPSPARRRGAVWKGVSPPGAFTRSPCRGSGPRPCARSHGPAKSHTAARPW